MLVGMVLEETLLVPGGGTEKSLVCHGCGGSDSVISTERVRMAAGLCSRVGGSDMYARKNEEER